MKITWNGHSCFTLESSEGSAVFDPYAPGKVPGLVLPALRADAVFCSHGHADHGYAGGVALTGNAPRYTVRTVPCFHDNEEGRLRGENRITLLTAEGLTFAHLGDLGHTLSAAQLEEIGRADILAVPVGGYYTIGPREAEEVCRKINPSVIIPMHYRGRGFGYDVIGTVDAFLKLFKDRTVERPGGSSASFEAPLAGGRITVFSTGR